MPTTSMSLDDLLACLEAISPVQLLGLSLLRQPTIPDEQISQFGTWYPAHLPTDQLVAATLELIAYADRSRTLAHKLSYLRPIPSSISILEYPL